MTELNGKVALVTGAARGQGRSHAVGLARAGADIAACDVGGPSRSTAYATATTDELAETAAAVRAEGRRCVTGQVDVRDRAGLRAFVGAVEAELGGVDIVIANAGVLAFNLPWELTDDQWDDVIDVNLTGVWNTVRACLPGMVERGRGGSVVLISSAAGLVAIPGAASYIAAKHGVVGLMKALAVDLGAHDIRVNAVHPGGVDTPMVMNPATYELMTGSPDGTPADLDPLGREQNLLPIGFLAPEDITRAVLYLVGDGGRWVTGTSLKVDAGATVTPPGRWRDPASTS